MRRIGWNIFGLLPGTSEESNPTPSLMVMGLGNPGPQYTGTRHNVGSWIVDQLGEEYHVRLNKKDRTAILGEGSVEGKRLVLVRPRTYVNCSGVAATRLLSRYRVDSDRFLVISDDINLPVGKLRLRHGGGSGGHNGLESIITTIGTSSFLRLRVGVGRPSDGNIVNYVLGQLTQHEQEVLERQTVRIADVVRSILSCGINVAMNNFN